MNKYRISLLKHAAVFLLMIFASYSCSGDTVEQIVIEGLQKKTINVTVKKADWQWDNDEGRYDAIVNFPELTESIYEDGLQVGYVFIGQQGVDEVQKILPYVATYWVEDDQGNTFKYTETISCDFQLGSPGTVAFYIQASDLGRDDSILADYNFRVVFVW